MSCSLIQNSKSEHSAEFSNNKMSIHKILSISFSLSKMRFDRPSSSNGKAIELRTDLPWVGWECDRAKRNDNNEISLFLEQKAIDLCETEVRSSLPKIATIMCNRSFDNDANHNRRTRRINPKSLGYWPLRER